MHNVQWPDVCIHCICTEACFSFFLELTYYMENSKKKKKKSVRIHAKYICIVQCEHIAYTRTLQSTINKGLQLTCFRTLNPIGHACIVHIYSGNTQMHGRVLNEE